MVDELSLWQWYHTKVKIPSEFQTERQKKVLKEMFHHTKLTLLVQHHLQN